MKHPIFHCTVAVFAGFVFFMAALKIRFLAICYIGAGFCWTGSLAILILMLPLVSRSQKKQIEVAALLDKRPKMGWLHIIGIISFTLLGAELAYSAYTTGYTLLLMSTGGCLLAILLIWTPTADRQVRFDIRESAESRHTTL